MTEEEAKTKWCPFARTLDYQSDVAQIGDTPQLVAASVNREAGNYDRDGNETVRFSGRHRCIASACMAWRRQVVLIDRATNEPATLGVAALGQLEERWGAGGYCGLAGSPS